ncbi:MAG: hypothetical protein J6U10_03740 [Lachnospiraceae bacterium]|nr:hypothetical protein [Lachnospiraceae bacterium]MBP5184556.1 hypothetical protein [Lachnospiraceae bacterium]
MKVKAIFLAFCIASMVLFVSGTAFYGKGQETEAVDSLYSTPGDVLKSDTGELLDYFLNSKFFISEALLDRWVPGKILNDEPGYGSVAPASITDYTKHSAFSELIKREDFFSELDKKACEYYANKDIAFGEYKIFCILYQPVLQDMVTDSEKLKSDYIWLYKTLEEGEYSKLGNKQVMAGVTYSYGGVVYSASNYPATYFVASRDFTSTEITDMNSEIFNYFGLSPVYSPSSRYNCHSYAWYRMKNNNTYWIDYPDSFRYDPVCSTVNASSVQAKDIVVYFDHDGTPLHSGVVWSVTGGNVIIRSKWGPYGVYDHSISNVPSTYCDSYTGLPNVVYYRYHDYTNGYAGQEYHSGNSHFYYYADTCKVCLKQTNLHWVEVPCSGPPCFVPIMNHEDEEEQ